MKKALSMLLTAALFITGVCCAHAEEKTENRYVCITVQGRGEMYAELYPDTAPITVENFMKLVNEKFYDGLTFHRIISGFMVQGGDPLGNGTGGSEENIKGEFAKNGVENPLKHERGVLSMARSSDMDSASSQFFIMHAAAPHLDGSYAAFGRVLSGMWIVDHICQVTPTQDNNGSVAKADQPVIESIREATKAEALAAQTAEEANGLAGTVYQDPMTGLSFPVPEGWNLTKDVNAQLTFDAEADAAKHFLLLRYDQFGTVSAAGQQQLAAQGVTRDTLDTDAFKKSSLAAMLGVPEEEMADETHSGMHFYVSQQAVGENGAVVYMTAAHGGVIYLAAFTGAKDDPLYADVLSILDQISFVK